jgi:hypothetical protein
MYTMTHPRRTAVALLAGTMALGACGGGGGGKQAAKNTTSTAETVSTPAKGKAARTSRSKRPSLASTPATTLKFSGTGPIDIGKPAPLRIPTNSTIKWTNDGPVFQIIPASIKVRSPVNSRAHSGEAKIGKGAYHGFLVNADGHWTVTIVPGG